MSRHVRELCSREEKKVEEQTLWMHIEPSAEGARRMRAFSGARQKRPLPALNEEANAEAAIARAQIATVAEALERMEEFAAAEVDLVDTENDVDEVGLVGYELGVYLDQLGNEERLDPGEMFGCLYRLLNVLDDSGLYEVELSKDESEISLQDMIERLPEIAEEAGYYVGPEHKMAAAAPKTAAPLALGKVEQFFVSEAKLAWPCGVLQLKRQWKILAARFHPDRNPNDPDAVGKFRRIKEGYDLLLQRLSTP
jgi:hypothetical protein